MTSLVNPDVIVEGDDFDLPMAVAVGDISPLTCTDFDGDCSEAINGYFDFSNQCCFEVITEFGLHCRDSVWVSLVIVKGLNKVDFLSGNR